MDKVGGRAFCEFTYARDIVQLYALHGLEAETREQKDDVDVETVSWRNVEIWA